MKPEWLTWIEENMPDCMLDQFRASVEWDIEWRDNEIARQKALNDQLEIRMNQIECKINMEDNYVERG